MKNSVILTTFVLAQCMLAFAADREGNGGDRLVKHFERSRIRAVTLVQQLPSYLLHQDEGESDEDFEQLQIWYHTNQNKLQGDISTSKHQWVPRNSNGLCGLTSQVRNSDVFLSLEDCRNYSLEEAALHLIGESAHHFGKDDKFISILANKIQDAWARNSNLTKAGLNPAYVRTYRSNPGNRPSLGNQGFASLKDGGFFEIDAFMRYKDVSHKIYFPNPLMPTDTPEVFTTTAYMKLHYIDRGICKVAVPTRVDFRWSYPGYKVAIAVPSTTERRNGKCPQAKDVYVYSFYPF